MHGELGYSLKALEGRLPASRSSLSRYLRGESLPDERLLVQWCKQSFTGEDRLPELVGLLHRANAANEAGAASAADQAPVEEPAAPEPVVLNAPESAGGTGRTHRPRRSRVLLATLGVAAVAAAAAGTVYGLNHGDDGAGSDKGAEGPTLQLTVYNVETSCQRSHRRECALGLAKDPYVPYRPSNIAGRVWHDDHLRALCRISNGTTVTSEDGGHSSIWFKVGWKGGKDGHAWMPGIRVRPEHLKDTSLRRCDT